MHRVRVKICGITREGDARTAEDLGADAVGFVFHPGSPRYIDPDAAGAVSRALGPFIARVGVFVDTPPEEMLRIARTAGLTAVQLHGAEPPEVIDALGGIPVIKAFRVGAGFDPPMVESWRANAYLFDTLVVGDVHGGTGRTFDWGLLDGAGEGRRYILAGGLTPENVAEAVRRVGPWGVDVSSGVERSPGIKDAALMRRFIMEAHKELNR